MILCPGSPSPSVLTMHSPFLLFFREPWYTSCQIFHDPPPQASWVIAFPAPSVGWLLGGRQPWVAGVGEGSEDLLCWLGEPWLSPGSCTALGVGAVDIQSWAVLSGTSASCRQILELPWKEDTFVVLQSLLERQVSRLP